MNFTLTAINPPAGGNGVPDAGSTVMLLGSALMALGGIRRFVLTPQNRNCEPRRFQT